MKSKGVAIAILFFLIGKFSFAQVLSPSISSKGQVINQSTDAPVVIQENSIPYPVVWDNGYNIEYISSGYASQISGNEPFNAQTADDFIMGTDVEIHGVQWWGEIGNYIIPPATPTEFNIIFYADDGTGNNPVGAGVSDPTGLAIKAYNIQNVTTTSVGSISYEFQATLPEPFFALAGVKYWMVVQFVGDFNVYSQWFWRTNGTNSDQLSLPRMGFPYVYMAFWDNSLINDDMAFRLYGIGDDGPAAVPILNWAIYLSALLMVVFIYFRMRKFL